MKLISPESLSDPQREVLRGYSICFPAGAVCVNVMLGREHWDVRPLLLIGGKVHLCRFSMNLEESHARTIADELAGFSVLFPKSLSVEVIKALGRLMVIRPFEASTLKEDLEQGAVAGSQVLSGIVRQLIHLVSDLSRRSVAHGHISPSNIALVQKSVVLLDPMMGALHQSSDVFLPPETELGKAADPSADLYSLGRIIKILLGESLTLHQAAIVDQLLLPSPRQRPPLVEVAVAFGAHDVVSSGSHDEGLSKGGGGRVVRPGLAVAGERDLSAATKAVPGGLSKTGSKKIQPAHVLGALAVLCGSAWMLKARNPELYYSVAARIPFLVEEHSAEYEAGWASRERARMAVVARAAVLRKEPAAIQTILEDSMSGTNAEGVRAAFLRVAFSDVWRHELSQSDMNAALAIGVAVLVPEGLRELPPLDSLHPGVLLAIVGQGRLGDQVRAIKDVPVARLTKLPEPFGPLFSQLEGMGASTLGDPRTVGLARIACGDMSAAAFKEFLGDEVSAPQTLAKISVILPVVTASPVAARELAEVVKDRGGDLAVLLGWFDLVEVAGWSAVPAEVKLRLMIGADPEIKLNDAQWSDLLTFPMEAIRTKAITALKGAFPDGQGEKVVLTLASPGMDLKREEIIALVSALKLPVNKRTPFITAWFELHPSADAVLLILLARSGVTGNDIFNLEAARYLRRTSWKAPQDVLQLLAAHPEPLARAIAYGKLNPSNEGERAILEGRIAKEDEPGCKKILEERLRGYPPK